MLPVLKVYVLYMVTFVQVREKRAELEKLKTTFVKRASEFLRNYFSSLVDFMINDKSYFSQVILEMGDICLAFSFESSQFDLLKWFTERTVEEARSC